MNVRNISPPDKDPILELSAETPEDGKTLKFIFRQANSHQSLQVVKVYSGFDWQNEISKLHLGYLNQPLEPKMTLKVRLLLALRILINK